MFSNDSFLIKSLVSIQKKLGLYRTNENRIGRIIQRQRFDYGKLDLIAMNEPGVLSWFDIIDNPLYDRISARGKAVWKITHQSSRNHLIVGLVNKNLLQAERIIKKKDNRFIYTPQLIELIQKQRGVDYTHLIIFGWIPKLDKCQVDYQAVLCCNFTTEYGVDNVLAKGVVRAVIKYCLNETWVPNNNYTWEESIKRLNIKELVVRKARIKYNYTDNLTPPRLVEDKNENDYYYPS